MLRRVIAFLVAPMAVPLLLAAYYSAPGAPTISFNMVDVITAMAAYAGAFLVGLPAYLSLRDKKWTAFWIAPIAGFMVAVVSWYVFIGVFPLLFGLIRLSPLVFVVSLQSLPRMSQPQALLMALCPIGPVGAITAILLWLIAGPDRTGG